MEQITAPLLQPPASRNPFFPPFSVPLLGAAPIPFVALSLSRCFGFSLPVLCVRGSGCRAGGDRCPSAAPLRAGAGNRRFLSESGAQGAIPPISALAWEFSPRSAPGLMERN